MEKHVIEALRNNETVTKNLSDYIKTKGLTLDTILKFPNAASQMNLFIEFFTRFYSLDIICLANGFIVKKSGTNVIEISAKSDYDNLFMILTIALINYCEKPF